MISSGEFPVIGDMGGSPEAFPPLLAAHLPADPVGGHLDALVHLGPVDPYVEGGVAVAHQAGGPPALPAPPPRRGWPSGSGGLTHRRPGRRVQSIKWNL